MFSKTPDRIFSAGRAYQGEFTSSTSLNQFLSALNLDVNFGDRAFAYHLPALNSPTDRDFTRPN